MKTLDVLLAVVFGIGALQGIIYGMILWRAKSSNLAANRFLALILFFFAYRLLVEMLKIFGLGFYDIWYHLFVEFNWIYGALIYFFVKAYVTPKFRLSFKRDWIHFLPVAIEFLWSNYIKSQNFYWDGSRESLSWLGYWGYVVWMHYPTMYLICGALVVYYSFRAEKLLTKTVGLDTKKTTWILRVVRVLRYYAIFYMLIVIIDLLFFDYAFNRFYHYPLFIGLAVITYWLGLEGFAKRSQVAIKPEVHFTTQEKEQLEKIGSKIDAVMTDQQLFKNQDLTLTTLAKTIDEKPYLTTRYLNQIKGKKFSDFVNELRIDALKNLLKDPANEQYTLLGLAFEVGFNSKASFNRAVKKSTGQSPKYLKANS